MLNQNKDNFPIFCLGTLLQGAISDACSVTGVPVALAAGVAFSAAALACQGHVQVKSPIGIVSPLSLYFLQIAKSGERKTTVEKLFLCGLRDFQGFHDLRVRRAYLKFDEALRIWNIENKALTNKLLAAIRSDQDAQQLKSLLVTHGAARPTKPQSPKIFYADTTTEAMLCRLHSRWPSALLASSEASLILSGRAAWNLAHLNVLWDGGEVEIDRLSGDSFTLRDARLSASLMIQVGGMQKFLAKGNGQARDIGFLARCLISEPASTQGNRMLMSTASYQTPFLDNFTNVTRCLLSDFLSDEGVRCEQSTVLEFHADAAEEWRFFYNMVEASLAPGGGLADIPDFASKISDNVIRLAAIFHSVEGRLGKFIDRATILSAIAVATWYLGEFKRLLGDPQQLSDEFRDSRTLEAWLHEQCRRQPGRDRFHLAHIRNYGPNKLRNKRALDAAIDQLQREGKVSVWILNKQRVVILNMQYFQAQFSVPPQPMLQGTAL